LPDGLQRLQTVFAELKKDKNANAFRADAEWPKLFDSQASDHFEWRTPQERWQWLDQSARRSSVEVPTENAAGRRWDFFAIIDAFRSGDCELQSCELVRPGRGRLELPGSLPRAWR